ncbi:hypothetical protein [Aquirhabdus parva]|nr:hypothetical protein [Aquirhabdus parva]
MENQDMPIKDQAKRLQRTEDEITDRCATLGILRRAKAVIRLSEKH